MVGKLVVGEVRDEYFCWSQVARDCGSNLLEYSIVAVIVASRLQSYWACIQDMYQCLPVAT